MPVHSHVQFPDSRIISCFARKLPLLEELRYGPSCSLTESDISILARSCPHLTVLDINASLDLTAFDNLSYDVVLPNLHELIVSRLIFGPVEFSDLAVAQAIDALQETLHHRMPELDHLGDARRVNDRSPIAEVIRMINDGLPRRAGVGMKSASRKMLEEIIELS